MQRHRSINDLPDSEIVKLYFLVSACKNINFQRSVEVCNRKGEAAGDCSTEFGCPCQISEMQAEDYQCRAKTSILSHVKIVLRDSRTKAENLTRNKSLLFCINYLG